MVPPSTLHTTLSWCKNVTQSVHTLFPKPLCWVAFPLPSLSLLGSSLFSFLMPFFFSFLLSSFLSVSHFLALFSDACNKQTNKHVPWNKQTYMSHFLQTQDCVEEKLPEITFNQKALSEWEVESSQETLFPNFQIKSILACFLQECQKKLANWEIECKRPGRYPSKKRLGWHHLLSTRSSGGGNWPFQLYNVKSPVYYDQPLKRGNKGMKGAHSLTSGLDNLCDEGGRANAEDIVSFKNKKNQM